MQSSPILVTGAAGFIGFHVALTLLKRGETVVSVDNLNDYYEVSLKEARLEQLKKHSNFFFHKIDVSDKDGMEKIWKEYQVKGSPIKRVIHLAAQAGVRYSLVNPYAYIQSNVMGHLVLLELARHQEGMEAFIYASTSSVYGSNNKLPSSIEDRTDQPISLYAATKKADELMSQSYAYLFKLPSIGLRFFTVYGPWGRPDMSALIFARKILNEEPISVFNHGNMRRDFTYIDDIVQGVIKALDRAPTLLAKEKVPHKIYNLGNHKSEPLLRFIELIEETLGKKAQIEYLPMQAGDVPESFADIKESQKELGFEPTTPIDIGIPNLINWFRDYYKV